MKRHSLSRTLPAVLGLFVCPLAQPAMAQTFQYEFGQNDLVTPKDVAVFRPCRGDSEYIFVADSGRNELLRYDGNGANNPPVSASAMANGLGPFGVAVDDSINSPNFGQVYTTTHSSTGGFGLVWIYENTSLTGIPSCASIDWDSGGQQFAMEPRGIAVDDVGNLYVVDSVQHSGSSVVLKIDAADVEYAGPVCILATPSLVIDTNWGLPNDVSVDKSGRIHVVHTCGCMEIFYPDGTPFLNNPIYVGECKGVDAKGDHLRSRTTRAQDVIEYDYDIPNESWSNGPSYGSLVDPRGLEFQKYLRSPGLRSPGIQSLSNKRRCEDRIFVADQGAQEIVVFGEDVFSTAIPSGAVAWWRFEESAGLDCFDQIGGNTLSLSGPGRRGEGRVGCGLGFEDNLDEARGTNDSSLNFGTGDFSFEGWICAEYKSGVAAILDKRGPAAIGVGASGYHVYLVDGYLGMQLMTNDSYENFVASQGYVADGKWHHIAVVVSRSLSGSESARLYVDGVMSGEDITPRLGSVDNFGDFILGNRGTPKVLDGQLDEVTLYQRALTAAEVMRIHSAGCAGKHRNIHRFSD